MSSRSPKPTLDLELHPASFPEPLPPPTDVTCTPSWLHFSRRRVGSPSPVPRTSTPLTSRELFSEVLTYIRAYEPDRARRVLRSIEDLTPAMMAKTEEAKEVIDAMASTEDAIARAQVTRDWLQMLTEIKRFENIMYFRKNGSPRRGYRFPLPKTWLFISCEAFAFLGRVESAERTLNQLAIISQLSYVEQAWLMSLIAYASGNVRLCLSLLQGFENPTGFLLAHNLWKRANVVQNVLDELEGLDFASIPDRIRFEFLQTLFMQDDSYKLTEKCIRLHMRDLYTQKLDALSNPPALRIEAPAKPKQELGEQPSHKPKGKVLEQPSLLLKAKGGGSWGRAASASLKKLLKTSHEKF